METKPYSIQSPEQIAKDYGGNKQKIAEAMQMGVVDPTAGTLAGMFIDRMRSAAQAEQAPQQTVAQQVFTPPAPPAPMGGVGAPPPIPPQGAPAGLGATPEAAQMPQIPAPEMPVPEMGAPEMAAPEEEAPMGMAGGGLTTLPLPDAMFDEPDNGSYADGGIVAFAKGGPLTDEEAWSRIKRIEGGLGPKGEMRVSSAGAVGPSQLMPATAPEAAKLAGLPWDEKRYRTDAAYNEALGKAYYLARVAARKGDYNKAALDYHSGMGNVDKGKIGPAGREYARKFSGTDLPERNTRTAEGFTSSLGDLTDYVERRYGKTAEEKANDEAVMARAKEMASPEYAAKEAKDSMWKTLAAIGFGAAASDAPDLASALFKSTAAELGNYVADKKERKQLKDKALDLMVANGAKNRKDAMERFRLALEIQQNQLAEKTTGRKLDLDERQVKTAETKLAYEIAAAEAAGEDVNDRVTRYLLDFAPGSPEHEAARRVFEAKRPPASTSGGALTPEQIRGNVQAGRTGGTAEGTTAKDSDGKTIVFSNGQWMYP